MTASSAAALASSKAGTLIEALPYIRSYRGQTVVVKIGGEPLDESSKARVVAEDLALMALVGIRLVVVHGGGPQVTEAMERSGITPRFIGGLRVTDDESIELVRRVLIGSINADLVGRLCAAGLSAVGLSGGDGALISAEQTSGPAGEDIGRVGRIQAIDTQILWTLLEQGHTPVIASVAPGADGAPLNVNADEVAGAVAGAVHAAKLVFLTNVEGLYRDLGDRGSMISELKVDELETMIATLSHGMRPKASSAAGALRSGVGKVHILDGRTDHALLLEVFTDEGIGTQVIS